ncbi:MAG: hypothetical protein ACOX4Z_02545 [Desulfobulbus sp.]|jgi:hypothetical protein
MKSLSILAPLFAGLILLAGCALPSTDQRILDTGSESQLQKRSYQSRMFETGDKEKVMRAVISTLQDLGFIIDRADLVLGTVSGTKLDYNQIKITVSVRPRGEGQMLVRANAQFNLHPIEDPQQYQDFFSSLEKSLFLTAHAGE